MQDPSQGVDPRLLPHLHLLIIPQAPKQHKLNPNAAVDWLQKVPQLVKERPVSWQFIGPQETGTMFFEWIHPGRTDKFPSDGYAWLDMEYVYEREVSEQYMMDILVAHVGVVPDTAPTAFMRTRYRIRSKHNMPGPFDPSFWLVHYSTAEAQYQTMVQRGYQIRPEVVHILNERRMLQTQGLPQRKDFMLVDRNSWPQVHYPATARGGPPYATRPGPAPSPGQPPYAYAAANAHAAGPPAKRARQSAPSQSAAAAAPPVSLYHDAELELIEDTSSGDYLDNISPAQISRERFKRHHLWLEEVFSSLYSPSQILPEDLGFGLVGELGELTKGLLNPPLKKDLSEQERKDPMSFYQDPQINASSIYKQLDADQYADFEKRVAAFVDGKNKEMDGMRTQHAQLMSRISKGKYYVDAEERLKDAGIDAEKVEAIVAEVQGQMGISLLERHDVVCVDRGDLEDEPSPSINGAAESQNGAVNGNTNAIEAIEPNVNLPGADVLVDYEAPLGLHAPAQVAANTADAAVDAGIDAPDGMDLDVPAPSTAPVPVPSAQPAQPVSSSLPPIAATQPVQASTQAAADASVTAAPLAAQAQPPQEPLAVESAALAPPPADASLSAAGVDDVMGEPDSIFDGTDFNNFDGIEGEFAAAAAASGEAAAGEDGLLDFGAGEFGDAAGTGTTPTGSS